jgi:hypothetical protein
MSNENLNGYIDLCKLKGVQYLTVNGQPSLVIPTAANKIKVSSDSRGLSAFMRIKCDAVSDSYREKERENHQGEEGWDESRLTSHIIIRAFDKAQREKIFSALKEQIIGTWEQSKILEEMGKLLKRDGSEGTATMGNVRGWDKLLWHELESGCRIGRLSSSNRSAVAAPAAEVTDAPAPDEEIEDMDDLPF